MLRVLLPAVHGLMVAVVRCSCSLLHAEQLFLGSVCWPLWLAVPWPSCETAGACC
jgi:hypothetical protein